MFWTYSWKELNINILCFSTNWWQWHWFVIIDFFYSLLCQHCPQRISRTKAVFLCLFWEQIGQIFNFFKILGRIHWFIQLNMIEYGSTVTESNVFRILIKILPRRWGLSTFNVRMTSIITILKFKWSKIVINYLSLLSRKFAIIIIIQRCNLICKKLVKLVWYHFRVWDKIIAS